MVCGFESRLRHHTNPGVEAGLSFMHTPLMVDNVAGEVVVSS